MRPCLLLAIVLAVLAACGSEDAGAPAAVDGVSPTAAGSTVAESTTATSGPASSVVGDRPFTVAAFGPSPDRALGPTGALGSGCSPESDSLPDGVWFGWVTAFEPEHVDFDLACLWPGHREPAASNDAARIRRVLVAATASIYPGDGEPISYDQWGPGSTIGTADNAPGLPRTRPFWLFVNGGVVTEIVSYPEPVSWARSAAAWPTIGPGCCDQGDVAPPSPDDPWPEQGWPSDGFYSASVEGRSASGYDLTIRRWLSCRDNPGLCPDWWVGDEVITDPSRPSYSQLLPFDDTMVVVIKPILVDTPIVGGGTVFGELLDDLGDPVETPDGFGPAYRAPGGVFLTDPSHWWATLEIRAGKPILYIHAGLIAG